jgi:hypothetical protein
MPSNTPRTLTARSWSTGVDAQFPHQGRIKDDFLHAIENPMPITLLIRRHARSRRPQGMNAIGQRAHMHRGRRRLAARTIDV